MDLESEGKKTINERAQNLQNLVRGPLASSIENLSNSARSIPLGTDFHFYNNFAPFRHPITELQNCSESLLREIGSCRSLWKRPSLFPADPEDAYEWLVNMQDDIFERVDVSMDEFKKVRKDQKDGKSGYLDDLDSGFQLVYGNRKKGGKNRRDVRGSKTPESIPESYSSGVKVASRDKKTMGGRSRVPFHLPSITKPQDRYNIVVDNSNTPFKHQGLQKTEDGSKYIHPLQTELDKMEFADMQSEAPEPLQPYPLESTPYKFVERVQDLKEMAIKLRAASEIAVDLEHNQYRSFQGLTCLMQISTRLEDFVVDTLILHNHIGPCLRDIFSNTRIKKVMHGADRDILWLQCDFGIYVCNLFDTGQASRILQLERNSLEFLLQHYCGITADKEYQTADWRLRPLPREMLKYAREDTHYLLYVHDVMRQNLVSNLSESSEAPILEVYKRSRDICLQLYEKERLTETSYLHVYGLQEGNFSPEQLAVVAGLYKWRDRIARVEDESTGYILPNKVLLQIAKRIPNNLDELRSFVKVRHPFVERNLAAVLDVIKQSRQTTNNAVDIAPKQPVPTLIGVTNDSKLKEMLQIDNRSPPVPADITTAVDRVSYSQTYDDDVLSINRSEFKVEPSCANSVEMEIRDDRRSISKEDTREEAEFSKKTVSHNERQAEVMEPLSSVAGTSDETIPFKKSGLASAVVGRASSSLLFNKKRDSVKESDTKNSVVCQSLTKQSSSSLSPEGVSSESPKVANFVKVNDNTKQAENLQLSRPAEFSNSGDFILNERGTCRQTFLQSSFAIQEEATMNRNTGLPELRVPMVQTQKKPGRGLAAMLGSSNSKQKNAMCVKMHDTEQDNARIKVEQIKASITLPFLSISKPCETTSIEQSSPKFKEDITIQGSQIVEVCAETTNPKVEIANAVPALKKLAGIVHSEEGRKYRAWWPPVQFMGVGKASATTETNDRELPPSLSELRKMQYFKHQPSSQFRGRAQREARSSVNDFLSGKKRKNHPSKPSNGNKVSDLGPETESHLKPFDYAAARQSMHFETRDTFARDVKGNAKKNFSGKKKKGSAFDPMNRFARESTADGIQPGKRRQVFPASGNRSATFR